LIDDKVIYETNGTYAITFTYDYDGKIISFSYDPNINVSNDEAEYFYLRNQQGDITHILDASGNTIVKYRYDAYGNIIDIQDTSQNDIVSSINPYTYRGYRFDSEIRMYYLNSRYYVPEIGRFLNSDGLLGQIGDLQSTNMYAYCANNPVMHTDVTGHSWKSFWSEVKEWFEEEYAEIFVSLAASYFGLSYLLPNGFAFATKATLGSMLGGFALACVYVVGVAIVIYFVIKAIQIISDTQRVMPGDDYDNGENNDEVFI